MDKNFIRIKDRNLVLGAQDSVIYLRGVSFGNMVWTNEHLPYSHHTEKDFERLREMGMNVVRFYMNYQTFEEDERPYQYKDLGWEWLDKNIAWAKKNGVYLILNMHVPQGGFQSLGKGEALWDNKSNQSRLKALYKAIAQRYSNETTIVGFDLVNEPVVSKSIDQWKTLAQELTDEIRKVDENHIIIVERLNAVAGRWDNDENLNYFLINDPNVMYTFHYYGPIEYTHQNASWTSFGDGGKYPNTSQLQFPSDLQYTTESWGPKLKSGDSEWKFFEGERFQVKNEKITVGKPAFANANNSGKAFYDDIVVKEYDSEGTFIRDVVKANITSTDGWYFWRKNEVGRMELAMDNGHGDELSIALSATTDNAVAVGSPYRFEVKQGNYYQINGWMKGEDVSPEANCFIKIDFESSPTGGKPFFRDKNFLENDIKNFLVWGEKHNLPVYCGEFGVISSTFQGGKGGLTWVNDVLDIFDKYHVHYTYHSYHEDAFGLYYGYNSLPSPDNANTELIKLFKDKLANKGESQKPKKKKKR